MADFNKIIGGFRLFKATTYNEQKDIIGHLIRQGLKPSTLFITCSGLRISPDVIFSANPGDFYVFRNLAALVPAHDSHISSGISAAIDHAVDDFKVESVVILGHAKCESIRYLMREMGDTENNEEEAKSADYDESEEKEFTDEDQGSVKRWLSIAEEAKDAVKSEMSEKNPEEQETACEQESILVSLKNLIAYPSVANAIEEGRLSVYGWHFDIENGQLLGFNPETQFFDPIG